MMMTVMMIMMTLVTKFIAKQEEITLLIGTSHREHNIMAKCFGQITSSSGQPLVSKCIHIKIL
jgi:hypothetical protein